MSMTKLLRLAAAEYNFDHPDAFDTEGMIDCLERLNVRLLL